MAGAAKRRANQERDLQRSMRNGPGSSSGETSSSGKASRTAKSAISQQSRSHVSKSSTGLRYDGNRDPDAPSAMPERDPNTSAPVAQTKNLDLGMSGWTAMRGTDMPGQLPPRPAPSSAGQNIKMGLNVFKVTKTPTAPVYQFDVLIGNGAEKRGLIRKVWESRAVKNELGSDWVFDYVKLAWSMNPIDREKKITVDLDAEQNRPARPGKPNTHRIIIRQTNRVRLDVLLAWLARQTSFDNSCIEAVSLLDHVLRETPSKNLTQIKRSFFQKGQQRFSLGGGIEAFKGVYASMRAVNTGPGLPAQLAVNVDVANGMFWTEQRVHEAAAAVLGKRDINDLVHALRQGGEGSPAAKSLKKMRKLHVLARHRKNPDGSPAVDEYVIDKFVFQTAKSHKFDKDGTMVSVYDYFAKEFNVRLQYPDLPLVKVTKGKMVLLPMEVLKIEQNARYNFKLDERQTSAMIKFAVTAPKERWADVQHGLSMLNWRGDPVLGKYGLQIDPNMTVVPAKLLTAPVVKYQNGDAKPGTSGRWDLKGKKFLKVNSAPLKSWAVCVVPGSRGGKPDKTAVETFLREFIKIYKSHGGVVENTQPALSMAQGADVGSWVTAAWNAAGNQSNSRPQILVFILPDKNSETYGRIKRSGECRYGVVSQCMQYAHVQKCQGQYISNVCMKFNAKLGGATSRAIGAKSAGPSGIFGVPTAIIGADVTHGAPGADNPSIAAMTVSQDILGIRYAAACETNGFRVEMITTDNINSMMKPMLQSWIQNVGGGNFPKRIIYFRDGVADAQYQHVLQQEVHDMKQLIKSASPTLTPQFIVVVGGKRHHIRFFPEAGKGDRNNNPFPGTLVEQGCTHPFENDFYLCSHAAIKGTARPMHYYVLLNEARMSNEELQTLIYEQCYQYIKATTPISQHPAIYYAHIAAARAIPHDPKWAGSSDGAPSVASRPRSSSQSGSQGGGGGSQGRSGGSSSGVPAEFEKLMPMPNQGAINSSMWYI